MSAVHKFLGRPLFISIAAVLAVGLLVFVLPEKRDLLLHMLCTAFGVLLALAVHELGHLIFGLAAKLDFKEYTVGFLTLQKYEGKIRLDENKRWAQFGGLVVFTPPANMTVENITSRWKLLALGGPLFSFMYGMIAFALGEMSAYGGFLIHASGVISLAVFVVSIFPHFEGGGYSDGAVVWLMQRGGHKAELYLSSVLLLPLLFDSNPPDKWPHYRLQEARRRLTPAEQPLHSVSACMEEAGLRALLYYYTLTVGEKEEAVDFLLPVVQCPRKKGRVFPPLEGIDSLFVTHHVLWGSPLSEEEVLQIAARITSKEPNYSRFQAAYFVYRQQWGKAREALALAKEHYRRQLKRFGYSVAELVFLEEIERRIDMGDGMM